MTLKRKAYNRYAAPISRAFKANDPIFSVKIKQVELVKYARSIGKEPSQLSKQEIGMFVAGGYQKLADYRGF